MKKTIKKVVAKAPVKKTVVKKPMMKKDGLMKKPLRKAQYGDQVKEGPLSEEDTKRVDKLYNFFVDTGNRIGKGSTPTIEGYSSVPQRMKEESEKQIRSSNTFNTSKTNFKKGGTIKSKPTKKTVLKSKKK